jgi:hypothetical protein
MLKCGDFYKDYKVKAFLNAAQEVRVKSMFFFTKRIDTKEKGPKSGPPLFNYLDVPINCELKSKVEYRMNSVNPINRGLD